MSFSCESIRPLFSADDGCCPEICISRMPVAAIADVYAFVRQKSRFLVGSPVFWVFKEARNVPLDAYLNPGLLVASGDAEPFHFLVSFLEIPVRPASPEDTPQAGIRLPDIGVFVMQNAIALDYERGPHWTDLEITAFLELLQIIGDISPDSLLSLEQDTPPALKEAFIQTLTRYLFESEGPAPDST